MERKEKNDYIVLFQGIKLTRREANKVGLAIVLGIVGALGSTILFNINNKVIILLIIFSFTIFGYSWLGNKIFKK